MYKTLSVVGMIGLIALVGCQSSPPSGQLTPGNSTSTTNVAEFATAIDSNTPDPIRLNVGGTVLEFRLEFTDPTTKTEAVQFKLKITNVGDRSISADMHPSDLWIFVKDAQGSDVWNTVPQGFLAEPADGFSLAPGDSHTIVQNWDLLNRNGDRLWSGTYSASAEAHFVVIGESVRPKTAVVIPDHALTIDR